MMSDQNAATPAIRPGWRGRTTARKFLRRLETAREKEIIRADLVQADERIEAVKEGRPPRRIKPRLSKLDRLITKARSRIE